LEGEGVTFNEDGSANMSNRVTWDVLRDRLNQPQNGKAEN
jgi:hypothetical protein